MTRFLLFFAILMMGFCAYAQPSIAWQRCYGSSYRDYFMDAKPTVDSGYITCIEYGGIDFDAEGVSDLERPATLMKFDSDFNVQWYSSFGGFTNASNFYQVEVLSDNGFVALGNTYATDGDFLDNHGSSDITLVRTDSLGQKLWSKSYGSPGSDFPSEMMVTQDKGYLICGYSNSSGGDIPDHYGSGFSNDIVLIKTDSLGNILWSKNMGTSGDDGILSNSIEIERGYYILNLGCIGDDHDMAGVGGDIFKRWLLKMDSTGVIVDENIITGETDLKLLPGTFLWASDGKIYNCTSSNPLTDKFEDTHGIGGGFDGAVAVFNYDLDFIDLKVFGGTGADFIKNSTFDEFGNIYLTGLSTSLDGDLPGNYNDGTNYDYWLLKLTSSLDVIWSINFGGGGNSESSGGSILGNHIVKNNSLFFFSTSQSIAEMPTFDVECGHYNPADQPSMDAWLVAFDLPTKIDNVTLNENDIEIYPNPANDVIFVRNKSIKNLHFTIYSITGVVLKSGLIINGNAINISELNKGFYIINLSYDNISQTNLPIIITH